jgi:hypothetical protein
VLACDSSLAALPAPPEAELPLAPDSPLIVDALVWDASLAAA